MLESTAHWNGSLDLGVVKLFRRSDQVKLSVKVVLSLPVPVETLAALVRAAKSQRR